MKIVFLGTSHGYPEAHRRCSSALIEVGEKKYIIDIGCNVSEDLATRAIAPDAINAIFITHMHGDHSNGLIPYLDICSWKFKSADPDIFLPADTESVKNGINGWTQLNGVKLREFKFHEITEGEIWNDGTVKVTAYRTMHIATSYAFLIEAEGKRILFSGDLCHKGPQNDFPISVFEKPLNLAICEAAHFDAKSYLPIFENTGNLKKLCFNHYSPRFTKSVYEVRESMDIPVIIACDGTELTI